MKLEHRKIRSVLGPLALVVLVLAAGPAHAHGAPVSPVSRSVACTPDTGRYTGSPACEAALAASPGAGLDEWDNIRLREVNGKDRERIPDGKLCSAGIDRFRGLDLPRGDWPVTRMTAGSPYTFRYRAAIPHAGRFELYLTRPAYDPSLPLKWSDLEPQPFLTVTDPPLTDQTYSFTGQVPAGRTGRHLILAVWRNTQLPDTYYSCSDVHFPGEQAAAAPAAATAAATDTPIALAATAHVSGADTNGATVVGASLALVSVSSFLLLAFWVRRVKNC